MPTAIEFEISADELDRAADEAELLVTGLRDLFGPDVLSGGELTRLVETTIDVAERTSQTSATELRDLAGTCRTRAATCRQYADDVAAYNNLVEAWRRERNALPPGEPIPRRPTPPASPPSWVEL